VVRFASFLQHERQEDWPGRYRASKRDVAVHGPILDGLSPMPKLEVHPVYSWKGQGVKPDLEDAGIS
jgi:hypothetical protein